MNDENAGGQGHMSAFLISRASSHCAPWTPSREMFAETLRNDLQENEDSETKGRWGAPCSALSPLSEGRGSGWWAHCTHKPLPCRPCTSSPLQSDSVMTISGATPTLCLLDKSKFEHFVVVDRTFVLKLANSDSLKLMFIPKVTLQA